MQGVFFRRGRIHSDRAALREHRRQVLERLRERLQAEAGPFEARTYVDTGPIAVPIPAAVSPGAACHALIQRLGVRFSIAGATRGVVDPVTVTPPIEGVHYRYASWTAAECRRPSISA